MPLIVWFIIASAVATLVWLVARPSPKGAEIAGTFAGVYFAVVFPISQFFLLADQCRSEIKTDLFGNPTGSVQVCESRVEQATGAGVSTNELAVVVCGLYLLGITVILLAHAGGRAE